MHTHTYGCKTKTFTALAHMTGTREPSNGCLHTGEAESLLVTQPTTLDASTVLIDAKAGTILRQLLYLVYIGRLKELESAEDSSSDSDRHSFSRKRPRQAGTAILSFSRLLFRLPGGKGLPL